MARILMLVINPMTADARVDKEAASLGRAGHDVTVLATAAKGLRATEERAGYRLVRRPYRRVVKDHVVQARRTSARRNKDIRNALRAVEKNPVRGRGALAARAALRAHQQAHRVRTAKDNAAYVVGGGLLKTVRSRIMPIEYWRGLVQPALPELTEDGPFDVVHCHDLGTLEAGWRAARSQPRAAKVVYDSHEYYVEQNTSWTPAERQLWKVHETRWISRADAVITVSGSIARALRQRYRLPHTPTVVHNAPPPATEASAADSDVRTDAGVGDAPLAVYVGGVKPGRGVEHLIPALPHAPRWRLAIIGAGHTSSGHLRDILDLAQEHGVADRVLALPAVPAATLPTYLASATLGVHPMEPICLNHEYALPNKLFDYVFAGLPVAVSDLTEMRAFVEEYGVGTTFDPYRPEAVAAALDRVLDEATYREAAAAATPAIRERFGWAAQEQVLFELYDRIGVPTATASVSA